MSLKSKSIKRKVFSAIIYALIIQESLFIFAIIKGNIIENVRNSAFLAFESKVNKDSMFIQTQMEKYWGDLDLTQENINSYIDRFVFNNNLSFKEIDENENLSSEILESVSDNLLFILNKNYVTAAYIILDTKDNENDNLIKKGVYIKDIAPENNTINNSDLLLCVGEQGLEKQLHITRSSSCKEKYDFSNKQWNYSEVVQKTIEMTKSNLNSSNKNFGYWGKHVKLCDAQNESITYSVPIMDKKNNIYGVFGIEVSKEYMVKQINEYTNSNELYSCILAYSKNNNSEFESLAVFNSNTNDKDDEVFDMVIGKKIYNDIYEVKLTDHDDKSLYACVKSLNFTRNNEEGNWSIIGIKEKSQLFYYYDKMKFLIYISVAVSFIFGIVLAIMIGNNITEPIKRLVNQVHKGNPKKAIKLDKINIIEIDELSKEIMNLSARSLDSASKLSQILELLNMPIGAFEYKIGEEKVFCTKGFFRNLGIEHKFADEKHINISTFEILMKELIQYKDEEDNIYVLKNDGNTRYIKLNFKEDESKILGVINDVTQDVLKRKEIEHERDYDGLTGLLNRIAFRKIAIDKLKKGNLNIGAFIMIDLDSLKYVNDTYGHDYGDEYIKKAANVLMSFNGEHAVISRRSGDEFLAFIYGYNNKKEVRNVVEEMRSKMMNTILTLPNNNFQKIRASFGISWYPYDSVEYKRLSRYCDFAMYKSKNTAKGSIYEFNKDEYEKQSFLFNKKEELNKLIEEELIQHAFQPIVDIHTGEIYAYEALMRSKLETIANPFQIIQIATAESKLYEIERLTFLKALESFKKNEQYFGSSKMFINSIPNQMLSYKDTLEIENEYGEYLSRLVVELLENEQADSNNSASKIGKIKQWNSKLAIDDFGSGYNNESVLLDVTPDFVKIDMDIVQGVEFDPNRKEIIKNLTSYAKSRGIKIIAEGIETREQLECVLGLGVDYVQGYYLGRPEFIPQKLKEEVRLVIKEINNI